MVRGLTISGLRRNDSSRIWERDRLWWPVPSFSCRFWRREHYGLFMSDGVRCVWAYGGDDG